MDFRVTITVLNQEERDVEDRVVLALQDAGIEVIPESIWADELVEE